MPLVTITIPTYNRATMLSRAIKSSLGQTFKDFEVLISDNNSNDATKLIVGKLKERHIIYHRNKINLGMIDNWNKCIELARGKYILILGDDDILEPTFLEESIKILESYPKIGFTFTHCYKIDHSGKIIMPWGYFYFKEGLIKGLDYIYESAKQGCCLTNSSTVLLRRSVFKKIGPFVAEVAENTFDFNMWLKIATHFDVYFIAKFLVKYTLHPNQVSEIHWRGRIPTGKIGTKLEIIKSLIKILPQEQNKIIKITKLIKINQQELHRLLKQVLPNL